ncbi:hypothetical protein KZP23_12165 [Echinicola marina]|uniref:hypothetical protein n=1 Tax=Echinicola marina TaxID=2859768 RepID=UPI001CF6FF7C|nr:hypothetical protein [Echinicola marina]UCS91516.1 hypothetical protein KZP23_12165 [Echinicola marina]
MTKRLPRKIQYFIFIFAFLFIGSGIVTKNRAQNFLKKSETNLTFPKNLNQPDVDFDLKSTGQKKFKIVLEEKIPTKTTVKVFDIIGNLILEDALMPEDGLQKSYDFSYVSSQLFVVEVGNSKYNKTKSIYANPQGKKKVDEQQASIEEDQEAKNE